MKKILMWSAIGSLILTTIIQCNAQNFGFNGAGFFENRTEQSDLWLLELNQNFTARFPGGAVAKFADPYSNENGWGLSHDAVDSIQLKYGSDEEEKQEGALIKWHNRVDEQPSHSYLDDLINLQIKFPEMRVIWVANIFIQPERTCNAIEYLLAHNVNIVTIEMGNESYGQLNYNFANYIKLVQPLETALLNKFNIQISHISANNKTREQLKWNTDLAAWLPDGDLITIHYYILEGSVTEDNLLNYNTNFDYYFHTFTAANDFIITETNTKPSIWLNNTFLNAAYCFKFLNQHGPEFQDICWHNGVAPDIYGLIFNAKKGKGQIRNTTYYAFDLLGNGEDYFINTGAGYSIAGKAIYYTSIDLTSDSLTYGEGNFVPPLSFGYILPEKRDTLICIDSTFVSHYIDSLTEIISVDTVLIPACFNCDDRWYRFTHRLRCKVCRLFGNTEIVATKEEVLIKIPVYSTIEICHTEKIK